ncbi:MAG: 50S ribosomal protein L23 [Candidatus Dasytiphilus stammeri]
MTTNKKLIDHNILCFPHVSEKSSNLEKIHNTIVFQVRKDATKAAIKKAIKTIFNVEVLIVNTLQVKGKVKSHVSYGKSHQAIQSRKNHWKKAYITLKLGHKIELINNNIDRTME